MAVGPGLTQKSYLNGKIGQTPAILRQIFRARYEEKDAILVTD